MIILTKVWEGLSKDSQSRLYIPDWRNIVSYEEYEENPDDLRRSIVRCKVGVPVIVTETPEEITKLIAAEIYDEQVQRRER
jgi:hypothetical protein